MNEHNIPLFRTRATLATATQAAEAMMPPTAHGQDDAKRTALDRIIGELEEQIYKNRDAKNVWRWLKGLDSSPAALPAVKESAKRLGVQL